MKIIFHGQPVTKKNSRQIVNAGGKTVILPSEAYMEYAIWCIRQIKYSQMKKIDHPVQIKYEYFMGSKRKTDLDNLIAATNDILQAGEVLADDAWIMSLEAVKGYDRDDPRVEITIEDLNQK